MKEIEERYDRAQQRKELAKLSAIKQERKGQGQQVRILPRPSRLRAPELEAAAIKWRISIHLLSRSLPQVIITQLAQFEF